MSKSASLVLLVVMTMVASACGTTRHFIVDSNPKGALILVQPEEGFVNSGERSIFVETPMGVTPSPLPITFIGDKCKVKFTAEKRGYTASTSLATKESGTVIFLDLKRIAGVPDAVPFKKEDLSTGTFTLLPPYVEVLIHSGLGRVDKKEYSPEVSQKVAHDLNDELAKTCDNGNNQLRRSVMDDAQEKDWSALTVSMNKYLSKLNAKRLSYYSLPPYLNNNVDGFKTFITSYKKKAGIDSRYLVYMWSKCVTETKGRLVGNFAMAILGGVVKTDAQARGHSFYYDPSAFDPDSGTLVTWYVIDTKTSEVVYINQQVFPDITDADYLKNLASVAGKFPESN
jgi:hypothetical protein